MRILVAGDVDGKLKQLFAKVQNILTKSGPFEMLFCVGSFFRDTPECREQWSKYKEGREEVPVATYILGPSTAGQSQFYSGVGADGGELCANVTCLGQRGVYTTSSGLQVAYLSGVGVGGGEETDGDLHTHFTSHDVENLETYSRREGFRGVDILLTTDWPKGVERFTTPPQGLEMNKIGAHVLSQLATSLKPRYHFSAHHRRFYERAPYRNHQVLGGTQLHVTRFIALADVGNTDKKNRYLYAFSISPLTAMDQTVLTQQPPAVTNCPYVDLAQSKKDEQLPEQNFFFDPKAVSAGKKRKQQQQPHQHRDIPPTKRPTPLLPSHATPHPPAPRGPCWFCLSSPKVEKHLIVSIGDHSYLALPKGGLVDEHVLILPIGHYAASTEAPTEVLTEMSKFRSSLRKYFTSIKNSCVIFERNFRSQHLQLQVVPVPETPSDALRLAFKEHGRGQGLELVEVDREQPLAELVKIGAPYFAVEFDEGPSLLVRIKGRFPLQFGREVLASPLILNTPHRVDWKACSASQQEEELTAKALRKNFQPFDFTDD